MINQTTYDVSLAAFGAQAVPAAAWAAMAAQSAPVAAKHRAAETDASVNRGHA